MRRIPKKLVRRFINNSATVEIVENQFQSVTMNLKGPLRRAKMEDRDYLVVPVVMMVEGVLNGSQGPLYYPSDEISKTPAVWNHKPIVVYHPTMNGQGISACDPDVITQRKVGVIMNTRYDKKAKALKAEAWMEEERLKKVDNRVLQNVQKLKMTEVSTGLFTDNEEAEGTFKGKAYVAIARNYKPDHLAILPDQKGACSIADGAGLCRNGMSYDDIRQKLAALITPKGKMGEAVSAYKWVRDVYDSEFVYQDGADYYRQSYRKNKDGVELLGDAEKVVEVKEYRTEDGTVVGNSVELEPTLNRLVEENGKWYVCAKDSDKKLSKGYTSKSEAEKRMAQIEMFKHMTDNGGPGSGNFGHSGRPGELGGSGEGGGSGNESTSAHSSLTARGGNTVSRVHQKIGGRKGRIGVEYKNDIIMDDIAAVASKIGAKKFGRWDAARDKLKGAWFDVGDASKFTGNSARRPILYKERTMNKEQMVAALIANGSFAEEDQDFLMGKTDEQVEALHAKLTANEEEEPKPEPKKVAKPIRRVMAQNMEVEEEPVAEEPAQPLTAEEYVANAPAEIRDMLETGLNSCKAERTRLVTEITANKANIFSKEVLMNKSLSELQGIAALAKTSAPAKSSPTFAGQGGVAPVGNAEAKPEEPLVAPALNFEKK